MLISGWYKSCQNCGVVYNSSNAKYCGACESAKRRAIGVPEPKPQAWTIPHTTNPPSKFFEVVQEVIKQAKPD